MNECVLGDCLKMLRAMPADSVDLVLTDPPWHTSALDMDKAPPVPVEIWAQCRRVMKPEGWLMVFGPIPTQMPIMNTEGLVQYMDLVWAKPNAPLNRLSYLRPAITHESIQLYHRGGPAEARYYNRDAARSHGHANYSRRPPKTLPSQWTREMRLDRPTKIQSSTDGTRAATTILHFPNKSLMKPYERTEHPTQKPLGLLRYLIEVWSPPDGIVVDPFAGSGSTLIAARSLRRSYMGAELDPKWHAAIVARMTTIHDFDNVEPAPAPAASPLLAPEVPAR